MNLNRFKKIELLNFEGPVLTAYKLAEGFLIIDEYKQVINFLSESDLKLFIDGKISIIDSRDRDWIYTKESQDAKPSDAELINFMMTREQAMLELIAVLYDQVQQLTALSKIELGDDVIHEISRLKSAIS